jgi:uncharacterized membrane protein
VSLSPVLAAKKKPTNNNQTASSTAIQIQNITSTSATTTVEAAAPIEDITPPTPRPSIDNEKSQNSENADSNASSQIAYERAIVTSVSTITATTTQGAQQLQTYTIQYLSGQLNGKTRTLSSDVSSNPYGLNPRPGDKVLISLQPNPDGGEPLAYLESFDRRDAVYWLIAVFVLMMVLLAGWQGFKIAFSIFLSVMIIELVLIPAFLKGINPVPIALGLSVVLTAISTGFSTGWNKKSLVTSIGTLGGVIVAYLVSMLFANWTHLSGLNTEEDRMFFDNNPTLNPQALLFAGIIIAAMGVVEDVAVSIASGVAEVRQANPNLTFTQLFRSGMVVGRDHMGALANTLVFAYVGGSLSTLLLFAQSGNTWAKFINFDVVVDEIVRSLTGTIGLIFTVPITAFLAAWIAIKTKPGRPSNVPGSHHGHSH